jgi:hypothetical protein
MATWPSATKASTANLDSGTDSPASARADLKTNVDNVNSVIDMFNISSPSNEQILQYSSANARFELATAGGGGFPIVVFTFQKSVELGGGVERCPVTELVDTGGIASVSSTYNFTLPAGTYLVNVDASGWSISTGTFVGWNMFNISGDSTKTDFILKSGNSGSGTMWLNPSYKTITLSTTATFAMQMPSGGSSYSFAGGATPPAPVTFTKIA